MPKIIFTTDTIQRGGKERQLFILTKWLQGKNYDVKVLAKSISKENYLNEYGINSDLVQNFTEGTLIKEYKNFKKIIYQNNPDYVISWDFQTSLFLLLLSKRNGFAFINASIQHGIRIFSFSNLLRSLVCLISPFVIANSKAGLRANNIKRGSSRFVLYNGIENKFLNNISLEDKENLKKVLLPGYANNLGTIYITIANFVTFKDYFTVFRALAKYKKTNSFYYIIIGEGPLRKEIENAIKIYGIEEEVLLTGRIDNVSDYLFISDIIIHSSRGEGISNAILEGMYAGLPVIATNVGGIPETVFPESSLLFPFKDHNMLLDCLYKAPEYFRNFDKNSIVYKNHLKKFSVETMVDTFEKILGKVRKIAKEPRIVAS